MAVCLNISTVINIKIWTNSNQQTQSYKFTSHIAAFLSVVLITKMLKICMQRSYDQNVQLILRSYLPVVYGTPITNWVTCQELFVILLIYQVYSRLWRVMWQLWWTRPRKMPQMCRSLLRCWGNMQGLIFRQL